MFSRASFWADIGAVFWAQKNPIELPPRLANGTVIRQDAVPEKPSCESRFRRVWQQTLGMDYRMRVQVREGGGGGSPSRVPCRLRREKVQPPTFVHTLILFDECNFKS